jgi:hypothetical protein
VKEWGKGLEHSWGRVKAPLEEPYVHKDFLRDTNLVDIQGGEAQIFKEGPLF